jgi:hypothetical protein
MFLVVMQAVPPVPRQITSNGNSHGRNEQQQTQAKQPIATAPSVRNPPESPAPKCARDQDQAIEKDYSVVVKGLPDKDRWDKAYIVLTGALVLVGIFTFGAIWYQAFKTRDAAKASLLNVQHLVNCERPWFSVSFHWSHRDWCSHLLVINKGRTPGILQEMFAEPVFCERPDNLKVPPVYSEPCVGPDDTFFAPGDDYEEPYAYIPSRMVEGHRKDPNSSQTDLLVVYGKVTYTDTLSDRIHDGVIHETRWCYFWDGKRSKWVRCGPKEYSGHRDYRKGELVSQIRTLFW